MISLNLYDPEKPVNTRLEARRRIEIESENHSTFKPCKAQFNKGKPIGLYTKAMIVLQCLFPSLSTGTRWLTDTIGLEDKAEQEER